MELLRMYHVTIMQPLGNYHVTVELIGYHERMALEALGW
jgi:translation initiation factor IF-1